jgi:uncharacterized membrane protein YphA (DoxX/SURF4 family)
MAWREFARNTGKPMSTIEEQLKFRQFHASLGGQPQGPLARIVAFVLGSALLVVGFMFSLVALAVVAVGALLAGIWFWWKTRAVRRQIEEQLGQQATFQYDEPAFDGRIIEGEAVREPEQGASPTHRLN